ncbi:MAG: hypothetical protein AB7V16_13595 [Vulcanibacillus sp.]
MKDEKISIRLEKRLLAELTDEYVNKELYNTISFSEYLRRKLKKGEQK